MDKNLANLLARDKDGNRRNLTNLTALLTGDVYDDRHDLLIRRV